MSRGIGRNAFIQFGSTGLNTDYRTFSLSRKNDTVEKTAGADLAQSYISLFTNATATVEMIKDGTAAVVACSPGTEGTLTYCAEGSSSGKPYSRAVAMVTSFEESTSYNDLTMLSIEFQINGSVSDGTVA